MSLTVPSRAVLRVVTRNAGDTVRSGARPSDLMLHGTYRWAAGGGFLAEREAFAPSGPVSTDRAPSSVPPASSSDPVSCWHARPSQR